MNGRTDAYSPHFAAREFRSPDGRRTPRAVERRLRVLCSDVLEDLRAHFGKPIHIVSGYRSKQYNKGAPKSQHIKGRAADIRIKGVSPAAIFRVLNRWQREGRIPKGGLGWYPKHGRKGRPFGWVHVDTRGWNARWGVQP